MPKSPKGDGADPRQTEAFKNFDAAMKKIIQVPKAEIDKRIAAERKAQPRKMQ